MANGLKYPKKFPCEVMIRIGKETRTISDVMSHLTITPYFGFWGVDEIMKAHFGGGTDYAIVRTLESYATLSQAQAYIEGFMAGKAKRSSIAKT